jgi:PAS domain S-box-containing protein
MTTQIVLPPLPPTSREENRDPAKRQEALLALGRRALSRPDPLTLMRDAASLVAAMLGAPQCLVAEVAQSQRELVIHLETVGSDEEPFGTVVRRVSAEGSQSLAGYVLQEGRAAIIGDLMSETRFEDRLLREHGIRTVLAVPLGLPDRLLGVLAVCSREPCSFAREDLLFAQTVAQLVTATTAWGRAEKMLAAQQRRSEKLLETVKAIVLVLDAEGRILEANRTCEQISGFRFAEIRGHVLWNAFPVAQEFELFQTIFPQILQEGKPVQYESSLLTKDGNRRQIAWSCSVIQDEEGAVDSVLATGIDVTEQRRGEAGATAGNGGVLEKPGCAAAPNDSEHTPPRIERRRRKRRLYPYQQLMAPVVEGNLPSPRDFYRVVCRDISAGGFSYLSAEPPSYDALIVALGTPPALTHLHAQLKHVTEIRYRGKQAYVVGCAYTGRVFY